MGDKGNQSDEQNDNNNIKTQKRLPFKQRMTNALTELYIDASPPIMPVAAPYRVEWVNHTYTLMIATVLYHSKLSNRGLTGIKASEDLPELPKGTTADEARQLRLAAIPTIQFMAAEIDSTKFKKFLDTSGVSPKLFNLVLVNGAYKQTRQVTKKDSPEFNPVGINTRVNSYSNDGMHSGLDKRDQRNYQQTEGAVTYLKIPKTGGTRLSAPQTAHAALQNSTGPNNIAGRVRAAPVHTTMQRRLTGSPDEQQTDAPKDFDEECKHTLMRFVRTCVNLIPVKWTMNLPGKQPVQLKSYTAAEIKYHFAKLMMKGSGKRTVFHLDDLEMLKAIYKGASTAADDPELGSPNLIHDVQDALLLAKVNMPSNDSDQSVNREMLASIFKLPKNTTGKSINPMGNSVHNTQSEGTNATLRRGPSSTDNNVGMNPSRANEAPMRVNRAAGKVIGNFNVRVEPETLDAVRRSVRDSGALSGGDDCTANNHHARNATRRSDRRPKVIRH